VSSTGNRTLRAAGLGAIVFVVLWLVLISLFSYFLYDPSLQEFEREGVEPAVARSRLAVVVAGFLAAIPAGLIATRASVRHRGSILAVVLAAVGPPFVLGTVYLLGVGAEGGQLLAGLIATPLGALLGLGIARSRGGGTRA